MPVLLGNLKETKKNRYGNKSVALDKLTKVIGKNQIPNGYAFSCEEVKKLFNFYCLEEEINKIIFSINFKDQLSISSASINLTNLIKSNFNERETTYSFKSAMSDLSIFIDNSEVVAIRSSSLDEDGEKHSFAGIYQSSIGDKSSIFDMVVSTVTSFYSPGALLYRNINKFSHDYNMALLLQNFIANPKSSGIALTKNPLNDSSESIYIASNFGTCESICDGLTPADEIVISKNNLKVLESSISKKTVKTEIKDGKSISTKTLSLESSLTEEHAQSLSKVALLIEKETGHCMDIEWTISNENILHIIQARPIKGAIK